MEINLLWGAFETIKCEYFEYFMKGKGKGADITVYSSTLWEHISLFTFQANKEMSVKISTCKVLFPFMKNICILYESDWEADIRVQRVMILTPNSDHLLICNWYCVGEVINEIKNCHRLLFDGIVFLWLTLP